MRKKIFSFVLSFTVIAVAAATVNCGCLLAGMSNTAQKIESKATGHCDKHEAASESKEDCCLGCKIETGALTQHRTDVQPERLTQNLQNSDLFFYKASALAALITPFDPRFQFYDGKGVPVSAYHEPLYVVFRSFLI